MKAGSEDKDNPTPLDYSETLIVKSISYDAAGHIFKTTNQYFKLPDAPQITDEIAKLQDDVGVEPTSYPNAIYETLTKP